MAISWDSFDKIWASTSPLTPYSFSDPNYAQGWNFVGSTPPARQMWDSIQKQNDEKFKYLRDNFGTPHIVTQASDMTDTDMVYVYMGSEAGWNSGHWYYYNEGTSSWADGGVYNSVAFVTDPTLSIAGQPADAKAVGDALALKADLAGCTFTGNVTVTGGLTVEGTITGNLAGYVKIQNNAGFHNSIFRGKNLGTSLTAAQSAAIQAGTFDDMFIGDYWVIGGYNWRIGMFDPWYNVGDTNFATHHLGIIPDTILYNAQYNSTNTTEGGYVGSALYSGIGTARTTVKNAFGAAHVPTHRILLPTTCTGGKYTSWAWRDEDIMLMTEVMVYGARAWGAPGNNGYSVASQDCQWPLFALSPQHRHTRASYWLQDVASASWFARVDAYGSAYLGAASSSLGVRPAFALI